MDFFKNVFGRGLAGKGDAAGQAKQKETAGAVDIVFDPGSEREAALVPAWDICQHMLQVDGQVGKRQLNEFLRLFLKAFDRWQPDESPPSPPGGGAGARIGLGFRRGAAAPEPQHAATPAGGGGGGGGADGQPQPPMVGCRCGHPREVTQAMVAAIFAIPQAFSHALRRGATDMATLEEEGGLLVLQAARILVQARYNRLEFNQQHGINALTAVMKSVASRLGSLVAILEVGSVDQDSDAGTQLSFLLCLMAHVVTLLDTYVGCELRHVALQHRLQQEQQQQQRRRRRNAEDGPPEHAGQQSVDVEAMDSVVAPLVEQGLLPQLLGMLQALQRLRGRPRCDSGEEKMEALLLSTLEGLLGCSPTAQDHFRNIGGIDALVAGLDDLVSRGFPPLINSAARRLMARPADAGEGEGAGDRAAGDSDLHLCLLMLQLLHSACKRSKASHRRLKEVRLFRLMTALVQWAALADREAASGRASPEEDARALQGSLLMPTPARHSPFEPPAGVSGELALVLHESPVPLGRHLQQVAVELAHWLGLVPDLLALPPCTEHTAAETMLALAAALQPQPQAAPGSARSRALPGLPGQLHNRAVGLLSDARGRCRLQHATLCLLHAVVKQDTGQIAVLRSGGVLQLLLGPAFFGVDAAAAAADAGGQQQQPAALQRAVLSRLQSWACWTERDARLGGMQPEVQQLLGHMVRCYASGDERGTLGLASALERVLQAAPAAALPAFHNCGALQLIAKTLNPPQPHPKVTAASRDAVLGLLGSYLHSAESVQQEAIQAPDVVAALLQLVLDAQVQAPVLSMVLGLMAAAVPPAAEARQAKAALFSKYVELMQECANRQLQPPAPGEAAEGSVHAGQPLVLDLLSGIETVVAANRKPHQDLFRRAGCALPLLSLLNAQLPSQDDTVQLCCAVLRCLSALLGANASSRAAFANSIGYDSLRVLLQQALAAQPVPRCILVQVLGLALDEHPHALLADAPSPFPQALPIVGNPPALRLLLLLLRTAQLQEQLWGLGKLAELGDAHVGNLSAFDRAGVSGLLLAWLSEQPDMVSQLQDHITALLQMSGAYSLSSHDLSDLFLLIKRTSAAVPAQPAVAADAPAAAPSPQRQLLPKLVLLLRRIAQASGPSAFFSFSGASSGIARSGALRWPPRGYAVSLWIRFDQPAPGACCSSTNGSPTDSGNSWTGVSSVRQQQPPDDGAALLAMLGHGGGRPRGLVVALAGADVLVRCVDRSSPQVLLRCNLQPGRWYHLLFSHTAGGSFSAATMQLYVDGLMHASTRLPYPRLPEGVSQCSIAAAVPAADSGGSAGLSAFQGQMGTVFLLEDAVHPEQVASLHRLGMEYHGTFSRTEHSSVLEAADVEAWRLVEGADSRQGERYSPLGPRVLLGYSPLASAGRLLLDVTERATQPEQSRGTAELLPGTDLCCCQKLRDALHCLPGGVGVLLPLLPALDHVTLQPACSSRGNSPASSAATLARPPSPLPARGGADAALDSGAGGRDSEPGPHPWPGLADAADGTAAQDGAAADAEVRQLWGPQGCEHRSSAGGSARLALPETVLLLAEVMRSSPFNRQAMLEQQGAAVVAYLLRQRPASHLEVALIRALESLSSAVSSSRSLHRSVLVHLLLNLRLWARAPVRTQLCHHGMLMQLVKGEPVMMHELLPISSILDTLRAHYWTEPGPDSQQPAADGAASPEEMWELRRGLLQIVAHMMQPSGQPPDAATAVATQESLQALLAFVGDCADAQLVEDVVLMLWALLHPGSSSGTLVKALLQQAGGFKLFLPLLLRDRPQLRETAIRLLSHFVPAAVQGDTESEVLVRGFWLVLADSTLTFPLTAQTRKLLFGLMCTTTRPSSIPAIIRPQVAPVLLKLVGSCQDAGERLAVLSSLQYLLLPGAGAEARMATDANCNALVGETGWQELLLDLLVDAASAAPASRAAEGAAALEAATFAWPRNDAFVDAVRRLLRGLHQHCLVNLQGGWQHVEHTVFQISVRGSRGTIDGYGVAQEVLADVLEDVLALESTNPAASGQPTPHQPQEGSDAWTVVSRLATEPFQDNARRLLGLLDEVISGTFELSHGMVQRPEDLAADWAQRCLSQLSSEARTASGASASAANTVDVDTIPPSAWRCIRAASGFAPHPLSSLPAAASGSFTEASMAAAEGLDACPSQRWRLHVATWKYLALLQRVARPAEAPGRPGSAGGTVAGAPGAAAAAVSMGMGMGMAMPSFAPRRGSRSGQHLAMLSRMMAIPAEDADPASLQPSPADGGDAPPPPALLSPRGTGGPAGFRTPAMGGGTPHLIGWNMMSKEAREAVAEVVAPNFGLRMVMRLLLTAVHEGGDTIAPAVAVALRFATVLLPAHVAPERSWDYLHLLLLCLARLSVVIDNARLGAPPSSSADVSAPADPGQGLAVQRAIGTLASLLPGTLALSLQDPAAAQQLLGLKHETAAGGPVLGLQRLMPYVSTQRAARALAMELLYMQHARQTREVAVEVRRRRQDDSHLADRAAERQVRELSGAALSEVVAADGARRAVARTQLEETDSAAAATWLALHRTLTADRAVWCHATAEPSWWKLDFREDPWRRRMHLERNYAYVPYADSDDEQAPPEAAPVASDSEEDIRDQTKLFKALPKAALHVDEEEGEEEEEEEGIAESQEELRLRAGEDGEQSRQETAAGPAAERAGAHPGEEAVQQPEAASSSTQAAGAGAGSGKAGPAEDEEASASTPRRRSAAGAATQAAASPASSPPPGPPPAASPSLPRASTGACGGSEFEVASPAAVQDLVLRRRCKMVTMAGMLTGLLEVTRSHLCFLTAAGGTAGAPAPRPEEEAESPANGGGGGRQLRRRWLLQSLTAVHHQRYLLQWTALELFFADRSSLMLTFASRDDMQDVALQLAAHSRNVTVLDRQKKVQQAWTVQQRWRHWEISNLEYLMALNTLAGRTYNDLGQYPVMPWILADYTSEVLDFRDPATWRDLSKPVGALNPERLEIFTERFHSLEADPDIPPFHYGSHYSSAGIVLFWLLRLEPFAALGRELQGGRFDHADRLFHSLPDTWHQVLRNTADVKELIPEFFYQPQMLLNSNSLRLGRKQDGEALSDVVLPPWAQGCPHTFLRLHREALESEEVSAHLHQWIDLIFGYKQRGREAAAAANVFYHLTYEGAVDLDRIQDELQRAAIQDQISNFGQTPLQLFKRAHPAKHPRPAPAVLPPPPPLSCAPHAIARMKAAAGRAGSATAAQVDAAASQYGGKMLVVRGGLEPTPGNPAASCAVPVVHCTIAGTAVTQIGADRRFSMHRLVRMRADTLGSLTFAGGGGLAAGAVSTAGGAGGAAGELGYMLEADGVTVPRSLGCMGDSSVQSSRYGYAVVRGAGAVVSCGYWDRSLRLHALAGAALLQTLTYHHDLVTCVAASTDGRLVLSGSRDTSLIVWDVQQPSRRSATPQLALRSVLRGHRDAVTCVEVSWELDLVASAGRDGSVLLHSASDGRYLRELHVPQAAPLSTLDINPLAGLVVAHAPSSLGLHLWHLHGQLLASAECAEKLHAIASTADGRFLLTGGERGLLSLRWLHNLQPITHLEIGLADGPSHAGAIRSLAVSPDGAVVLAGTATGSLVLLSCHTPASFTRLQPLPGCV